MFNYLLVATGAAIGGMMRYFISNIVQKIIPFGFPLGTLTVNISGSFIIGFIMFYFDVNELISPEIRVMMTTGFCGALTTFSTFSFETVNLLRDGQYLFVALNIGLNLFFTIAAVITAYYLSKILNGAI